MDMAKLWLDDLEAIGYTFPPIVQDKEPQPPLPHVQIFVRMCSRFINEWSDIALRSMLFFWPLKSLDLLMVLDDESRVSYLSYVNLTSVTLTATDSIIGSLGISINLISTTESPLLH